MGILHRWIHCEKHNLDYPLGSDCPKCAREQRLTQDWLESQHNKDVAKCNAQRAKMNLPPRTNDDELDCRKLPCRKDCPIEV